MPGPGVRVCKCELEQSSAEYQATFEGLFPAIVASKGYEIYDLSSYLAVINLLVPTTIKQYTVIEVQALLHRGKATKTCRLGKGHEGVWL